MMKELAPNVNEPILKVKEPTIKMKEPIPKVKEQLARWNRWFQRWRNQFPRLSSRLQRLPKWRTNFQDEWFNTQGEVASSHISGQAVNSNTKKLIPKVKKPAPKVKEPSPKVNEPTLNVKEPTMFQHPRWTNWLPMIFQMLNNRKGSNTKWYGAVNRINQ